MTPFRRSELDWKEKRRDGAARRPLQNMKRFRVTLLCFSLSPAVVVAAEFPRRRQYTYRAETGIGRIQSQFQVFDCGRSPREKHPACTQLRSTSSKDGYARKVGKDFSNGCGARRHEGREGGREEELWLFFPPSRPPTDVAVQGCFDD